ncbi:MAG: PaaI family thioesterase [Rhodobacteraceae bacterium]|nr:PaaI family thioesterase [Paracoccaceae bacterium]
MTDTGPIGPDEETDAMDVPQDQSPLPPFAVGFGIVLESASKDLLIAHLEVGAQHANRNNVMHGGAILALADVLGGTAASLNLRPGEGTTTLESKTNFLRPVPLGQIVTARTEPLHRGRKTQVWKTTVLRADGKAAAITTQTQLTLRNSTEG